MLNVLEAEVHDARESVAKLDREIADQSRDVEQRRKRASRIRKLVTVGSLLVVGALWAWSPASDYAWIVLLAAVALNLFVPDADSLELVNSIEKAELRERRSQQRLEVRRRDHLEVAAKTEPDGDAPSWRAAGDHFAQFFVPALGDGSEEVLIDRWLIAAGDRVEPGQPLIRLSYDLWTVEFPCQSSGVVEQVLASADASAKIGDVLCVVRVDS